MARVFDVCIVGAGPHALSVLSALHRRPKGGREGTALSVCVVDPSGEWLSKWNSNFAALDINYLRSPLMAHPDANDAAALLEYAEKHGRLDEIREVDFSCSCLKGTFHHALGLYNLPSTALFYDFCQELSTQLPHEFVQGYVEAVDHAADGSAYVVSSNGQTVCARQIVLALGAVGGPQIPAPFTCSFDASRSVMHTTQCDKFQELSEEDTVLVVGGGLSAAQAALLAVSRGAKETVLCSRRPLTTRQFDVPVNWVNPRMNRGFRNHFFGLPDEEKPGWAFNMRGGGSIPEEYMERLRAVQKAGRLSIMVDEIKCCDELHEGGVRVKVAGRTIHATRVILATGSKLAGRSSSLCNRLAEKFALPTMDGYPVLSDGLKWGSENIYVTGALALLRLGPDASNLMGARTGAQMCATDMGMYDAHHTTLYGVRYTHLHNPGSVSTERYNTLVI